MAPLYRNGLGNFDRNAVGSILLSHIGLNRGDCYPAFPLCTLRGGSLATAEPATSNVVLRAGVRCQPLCVKISRDHFPTQDALNR